MQEKSRTSSAVSDILATRRSMTVSKRSTLLKMQLVAIRRLTSCFGSRIRRMGGA